MRRSWPISVYYPGTRLERFRKTTKDIHTYHTVLHMH